MLQYFYKSVVILIFIRQRFIAGSGRSAAAIRSRHDKKSEEGVGRLLGYNPVLVFIIPLATVIIILVALTVAAILISSAKKSASASNRMFVLLL